MTAGGRLRAFADVRLGRQRSPEHAEGPFMVPYLRAANVKDGYLDLTDVKEMNFTPAEQQLLALEQGDVLVSEGAGSLEAVGAASVWDGSLGSVVCFQNTLLRLRPYQSRTTPRFLAWWARHAYASGLFASAAIGVNIYHLSAERVRSLPVYFPEVEEQERIADFLDRETARIDALIRSRRRMLELVPERAERIADQVIWAGTESEIPLMHAVDYRRPVMYGIVLPGPDVPEGVPIVKGGDVSARRLTPDQLCRTTYEIEAPYARARLRAGDILYAIRGGVGDAAVVPSDLEGANITQDVARIAPAAGFGSDWLLQVLLTPTAQQRVAQLITGATIRGVNIRDLERIQIPWASPGRQEGDLAALRDPIGSSGQLIEALTRQLGLLSEHRQALITAAVTGDLNIAESE